jgi:hypothetical protein
MNFFLISWTVLALVVLALAGYRLSLSHRETDVLHLASSEGSLISGQTELATRIKVVSRWGEALTIAVVVYGLVLVAQYGYGLWTQGYKPPQ